MSPGPGSQPGWRLGRAGTRPWPSGGGWAGWVRQAWYTAVDAVTSFGVSATMVSLKPLALRKRFKMVPNMYTKESWVSVRVNGDVTRSRDTARVVARARVMAGARVIVRIAVSVAVVVGLSAVLYQH